MPAQASLEKDFFRLLSRKDYQPSNEKQIANLLKLRGPGVSELSKLIPRLETEGRIARIRQDCWILPKEAELVTGVLQFNPKGFAFLLSENDEPDYFISAEDTATAMHQDVVVARKIPVQGRGGPKRTHQARVIRIVKRRRTTLVGTLKKTGLFHIVIPDDPRILQNFYVPDPAKSDLDPKPELDDKVVVKMHDWTSRHNNPEGVITERLGKAGDPGVDIISIIRKHDLRTEFPTEALAEVAQFANDPNGNARDTDPASSSKRLDLRQEFIFTIDPDTAKDFDDAIHVRPLGEGKWEVGVHIADVSHYVRRGSELDREARRRGNSVYLVNQVIPMLPEELSNGLCSLLPNVDRLTYSAIVILTDDGRILSYKIVKTLIHSQHRLTYQQAFDRLQRPPEDRLDQALHNAWKLASTLRKNRMAAGSLDLDMPEVKVRLNDQGVPIALERVEHDISHQLIEEFMLMANEVVAKETKNKHLPAIYRVHESPDPEKLLELRQTLLIQGIRVGDLTKRPEMQKAIRFINESNASHALKISLLRSLKRAMYVTKPLGHYGLAKVNYTHFTSPIRRYADLVVHRSLSSGKDERLSGDKLEEAAAHICETERTAAEAEQESVRLKKFEFFSLQQQSDQPTPFPAVVTDVQNFGLFVEVPDFLVSGLIHISALKDDFYNYDDQQRQIVGKRTKRRFSVGDKVMVQVERIDMFKQQIDFKLAPGSDHQKSEVRMRNAEVRTRQPEPAARNPFSHHSDSDSAPRRREERFDNRNRPGSKQSRDQRRGSRVSDSRRSQGKPDEGTRTEGGKSRKKRRGLNLSILGGNSKSKQKEWSPGGGSGKSQDKDKSRPSGNLGGQGPRPPGFPGGNRKRRRR